MKSRVRGDLDSLVINTELTLISIIQGCALYWVINCGFSSLVGGGTQYWGYIATGLVIILLFWSRALLHTFTLIRWPIEFGHNFLYILCTFLESIMFTQITDPFRWHAWGAAFWAAVAFLFGFDMKMIRERMAAHPGPHSQRLFETLAAEQSVNIRVLMPALTFAYAIAAAAIRLRPDIFIDGHAHQWLGWGQAVIFIAYQAYVLRFFRRISPLILAHREAEDTAG